MIEVRLAKKRQVSVSLSDDFISIARRIGDGNVSLGIQRALWEYDLIVNKPAPRPAEQSADEQETHN